MNADGAADLQTPHQPPDPNWGVANGSNITEEEDLP